MLGVAVLAKGLLPLVLAAPLAWGGRRRLPNLLHPRFCLPVLAVAGPWYVLCWWHNGAIFIGTRWTGLSGRTLSTRTPTALWKLRWTARTKG